MFNKVILIGRLTALPELKQTPNGTSVTSFTAAVDRAYSTNGEKQTDFINCVAWRHTAEFISKYFAKGAKIGLEGSIQTRSYTDKNGNKRTAVEVVADNAFFVESKKAAGIDVAADDKSVHTPVADTNDFQEIDDDGDLPF